MANLFYYLFIYLFILLCLGVTYIKNIEDNTKPGRDTTTVRANYCGPKCEREEHSHAKFQNKVFPFKYLKRLLEKGVTT